MNEIKDKLERSVVYILSSILHRTVSYLFAAMKPKFIPVIYSTLNQDKSADSSCLPNSSLNIVIKVINHMYSDTGAVMKKICTRSYN